MYMYMYIYICEYVYACVGVYLHRSYIEESPEGIFDIVVAAMIAIV